MSGERQGRFPTSLNATKNCLVHCGSGWETFSEFSLGHERSGSAIANDCLLSDLISCLEAASFSAGRVKSIASRFQNSKICLTPLNQETVLKRSIILYIHLLFFVSGLGKSQCARLERFWKRPVRKSKESRQNSNR